MRRILILTLALVSLSPRAFSQGLSAVCERLSKNPITSGNFIQEKTISSMNRTFRSNGDFTFSPEGIMWKTVKPFPTTLVLTRTAMVQIGPDGSRNITDVSGSEIFTTMSSAIVSLFSNDATVLEKNFFAKYEDGAGGKWAMTLLPKDSMVKAVMASIEVAGDSENLSSIRMNEASGDRITYSFSNQRHPGELSDYERQIFSGK